MKKNITIICLAVIISCNGLTQTLDNFYTSAYTNEQNGPGYFAPFIDVMATNMNVQQFTSFYNDTSFAFGIGFIGVRSFVSDDMHSFMGTTIGLNPNQTLEVPTAFGNPETIFVEDNEGDIYGFPPGYAPNTISFVIPQLTFSGMYNTDISLRFIGFEVDGEIGKLSLLGGSIRHHIHPYFDMNDKIRLSLGYGYNQFNGHDEAVKITTHAVIAEGAYLVSTKFGPYLNLQYRSSTMDIDYEGDDFTTDFSSEGDQNIQLGLGAALYLRPVYLRGGIELFDTIAVSGTLGFVF